MKWNKNVRNHPILHPVKEEMYDEYKCKNSVTLCDKTNHFSRTIRCVKYDSNVIRITAADGRFKDIKIEVTRDIYLFGEYYEKRINLL